MKNLLNNNGIEKLQHYSLTIQKKSQELRKKSDYLQKRSAAIQSFYCARSIDEERRVMYEYSNTLHEQIIQGL